MGVKRSEYRRSYVKSPEKDLASDFESKFDYRLLRRLEEHRHTPFEWDYTSDSDSEYEYVPEPKPTKTEHSEKHKSKVQEIPYQEEINERTERPKRRERKDEHKEKSRSRPKRPLKPCDYRTIPKPRPLEPSSKHKIKQEASRDSHALFVPFGVGDKERSTGSLRTHNVRSTCDIYPSALRAKKRHEAAVERREAEARSRALRESRPTHFNAKMQRETSDWDSEYRNHFVGYETGAYKPKRASGGTKFYVPL